MPGPAACLVLSMLGSRQLLRWIAVGPVAALLASWSGQVAREALAEPSGTSSAQSQSPARTAESPQFDHFERRVRPIFAAHCVECHGPDVQEADLRFDVPWHDVPGGREIVAPGRPEESRLLRLIEGVDGQQMPPDSRLTNQQIVDITVWIEEGAQWPAYESDLPGEQPEQATTESETHFTSEQRAFWSFQPVAVGPIPEPEDRTWALHELDRFILAKLEAAGLRPRPPADKRTLLRRATYDLTGLPPTPDEMAEFLADDSAKAFAVALERLLGSPRYGERWGQHWLDVIRFAESAGHDGNNAYLNAWQYRDYVIRSFNSDKPFDRFVVEQLAGDLLPCTADAAQNFDQRVATGFLQVGPKPVVMRDKRQMLLDIADEQLHTTGIALLGLTIGCARCHDHKFDPIPTSDYYALAGIFTSTEVMADEAPDSKWIEDTWQDSSGAAQKIMVVRDRTTPQNLRIHRRGSYHTLGPEVPRRFLQIISDQSAHLPSDRSSGRLELAHWIADARNPLTARVIVNRIWQHHFGRGLVSTSGNFGRLGATPTHPELLDWLATQFVARGWSVKAMHRLIMSSRTYQQATGWDEQGLAVDAENELLWSFRRRRLSAEEIRDSLLAVAGRLDLDMGGSLFSEGYTPVDEARELFTVDISGQQAYRPFEHPRRSIYLPLIRNSRPEALRLFDAANEHEPDPVRGETTVAPQALFMMNSRFVREMAGGLAARVSREVLQNAADAEGDEAFVQRAYEMALSRPPTATERERALSFARAYAQAAQTALQTPFAKSLADGEPTDESACDDLGMPREEFMGRRALCHALLCLNEFIYIE